MNSASKDGGEKPGEVQVRRTDGKLWSPAVPGKSPLDDQMGAGEVNAQAALMQFDRPQATKAPAAPGTNGDFSVDPIAWDFNHVSVGNYDQYNINQQLAGGTKLTATLIWDLQVTRTTCAAPCNPADDDTFAAAALSHLDLDLYENNKLLHVFDLQGRASFSDSR